MAHTGIKPTAWALLAPCSDQLNSTQCLLTSQVIVIHNLLVNRLWRWTESYYYRKSSKLLNCVWTQTSAEVKSITVECSYQPETVAEILENFRNLPNNKTQKQKKHCREWKIFFFGILLENQYNVKKKRNPKKSPKISKDGKVHTPWKSSYFYILPWTIILLLLSMHGKVLNEIILKLLFV